MDRFRFKIFPVLALFLIAFLLYAYVRQFGYMSVDKGDWGTFGDFFGGVLNPIFALLAFLAVSSSLRLQMEQMSQASEDKKAQEILIVIKDIDEKLNQLTMSKVGKSADHEPLRIHHMMAEAERGAGALNSSDAYAQFIYHARQSGAMVEAPVREIRSHVITLHKFLLQYPRADKGQYGPIIDYYIIKTSRIVTMLRDIGGLPTAVDSFFTRSETA